ncbi:MAG: amidohydrolase [Clostridia bacterium]|nr:amidohydrolase [Clostridia bacterium]MBQ8658970.1 amidohydrolase [Clostridia bacterium]
MDYEIIDFHTHPFLESTFDISSHKEYLKLQKEDTLRLLKNLGVVKICGSVLCLEKIGQEENAWETVQTFNQKALEARDYYGDFYEVGFHVHPNYVKESCEEMERMHALGVKLIGELVPRRFGYDYAHKGLDEIFALAGEYQMAVSFHSMDDTQMDEMVARHKHTTFVAAHPLEKPTLLRHIDRMKKNQNCYLDLSGTGLFRFGMLRRLIDEVGAERILFGSDYPICSPAMYVGAIVLDETLTEREKRLILSGNAKRILAK